MPLDRRAARVAAGVAVLVALAAPPVARAGDRHRPSAQELWQAYPLKPAVTASAGAVRPTATPTPRPAASPQPAARPSGGGAPWLPIGLAVLALAGGAALWARRRPRAPDAPPAPAARPRLTPPPAREWPWPSGLERQWRCEVALAPAALSAQVQAVVHEPGGATRTVLAASPTGSGGADWQSSDALDEAIAALAAELEAHGWAAVPGGRPHTRRLYWPHTGEPFTRAREAAWTV